MNENNAPMMPPIFFESSSVRVKYQSEGLSSWLNDHAERRVLIHSISIAPLFSDWYLSIINRDPRPFYVYPPSPLLSDWYLTAIMTPCDPIGAPNPDPLVHSFLSARGDAGAAQSHAARLGARVDSRLRRRPRHCAVGRARPLAVRTGANFLCPCCWFRLWLWLWICCWLWFGIWLCRWFWIWLCCRCDQCRTQGRAFLHCDRTGRVHAQIRSRAHRGRLLARRSALLVCSASVLVFRVSFCARFIFDHCIICVLRALSFFCRQSSRQSRRGCARRGRDLVAPFAARGSSARRALDDGARVLAQVRAE